MFKNPRLWRSGDFSCASILRFFARIVEISCDVFAYVELSQFLAREENILGYYLKWNTRAVFDEDLQAMLNAGQSCYAAVDAFGEGGVTEGRCVPVK